MTPMTEKEIEQRIAEIRERLGNATPGPWFAPALADGVRHLDRNCEWYAEGLPEGFNLPGRQNGDGGTHDGLFIANAPADLQFLLAQVEEMGARLEATKQDSARLDWLEDHSTVIDYGDDEIGERDVTLIHGGVNDRQYTTVGSGNTVRAAIDEARNATPDKAPLSDSPPLTSSSPATDGTNG